MLSDQPAHHSHPHRIQVGGRVHPAPMAPGIDGGRGVHPHVESQPRRTWLRQTKCSADGSNVSIAAMATSTKSRVRVLSVRTIRAFAVVKPLAGVAAPQVRRSTARARTRSLEETRLRRSTTPSLGLRILRRLGAPGDRSDGAGRKGRYRGDDPTPQATISRIVSISCRLTPRHPAARTSLTLPRFEPVQCPELTVAMSRFDGDRMAVGVASPSTPDKEAGYAIPRSARTARPPGRD